MPSKYGVGNERNVCLLLVDFYNHNLQQKHLEKCNFCTYSCVFLLNILAASEF